jgi:ferritin-like metal-binding protein YciE
MSTTEKKIHKAISDWVGDIVALESHVEEAMDKQLKLKSNDAELTAAIQLFHDTVRDSKKRAVEFQATYGTTAGNPVIKAGSNLLGKAAGLIDMIREDSISKAMRDDYTAYNLLAISYTMLNTTAMALEDSESQAFAEQGLRTYATMVQEINRLMPLAVLEDLKDNDDHPIQNTNVVESSRTLIDGIWKSTS